MQGSLPSKVAAEQHLFPLQALSQPQHHHRADPSLQHEVHAVQSKGQLLLSPFQAREGKRKKALPSGNSALGVTNPEFAVVLFSSTRFTLHPSNITCSKQIRGWVILGLSASSYVFMCFLAAEGCAALPAAMLGAGQ